MKFWPIQYLGKSVIFRLQPLKEDLPDLISAPPPPPLGSLMSARPSSLYYRSILDVSLQTQVLFPPTFSALSRSPVLGYSHCLPLLVIHPAGSLIRSPAPSTQKHRPLLTSMLPGAEGWLGRSRKWKGPPCLSKVSPPPFLINAIHFQVSAKHDFSKSPLYSFQVWGFNSASLGRCQDSPLPRVRC